MTHTARQIASTRTLPLTGRIVDSPSVLLNEEVLEPQFSYERQHLLRWYVLIEKVLLLEHVQLGVVSTGAAGSIAVALNQIDGQAIVPDPQANMSDIAFAIERYVETHADVPAGWHVDRSRNDFQACAQVLLGREQVLTIATYLEALGTAVQRLACTTVDMVMPGYTHFQAAQVISPAFYLTAMNEQIIGALRRLLAVYDSINRCPLGAGAMAGQELPWNRIRMAERLGFVAPVPHALTAVASREWILLIASELSLLGAALSRFVTDFILWGSSEYHFIDLPDSLSGISSAMPQKKNFPILERVRGKTAHLGAFYIDLLLGQRNTPFSNLVEVSKEASVQFLTTCQTAQSLLRLFTTVIEHVQFVEPRLRAACEREFLGGFSLANYLTLRHAIPARTAQVIAGQYISASIECGHAPQHVDRAMLEAICGQHAFPVEVSDDAVQRCLSPQHNVSSKTTVGSTCPAHVDTIISHHAEELAQCRAAIAARHGINEHAYRTVAADLQAFL